MSRRQTAAALAVGLTVVLGLIWTARPAGSGLGWRLAFVGLHLGAFGLLLAWLRTVEVSRTTLFVGAVLFRLAALPMAPTLSDDGYRYVWDGLVAAETPYSPYDLRPSDPALGRLHDDLYRRLNSPHYLSVYPPASQAVFRVAALAYVPLGFAGSWIVLKLLLVAAEMVGIVLLSSVASARRVAVYAWSPLAVVEIAGQGHTEALVVAGLGAVVWGGWGRVPVRSIGVAIAGAAKLYPLALLPLAWRRERGVGVLATVAVLVALAVPVASPDALRNAMTSVSLFYGTLDWFSAPYLGLKAVLYPWLGDAAGAAASRALALVFAATAAVAWLTDDGTARSLRVLTAVLVAAAVLSVATLHPWYLVPVLAVAPLVQATRTLTVAAGAASLSYLAYEVSDAVGLVLLLAFWGLVLISGVIDWRSGRLRPLREGLQ